MPDERTPEPRRASPRSSAELTEILDDQPVRRIAAAVARMRAILSALPPGDGVGAFTRLYLAVTEAVAEAVRGETFEDPPFLRRLDVAFANLYFDALRSALLDEEPPPKAWAPLVEARGRRGVLPLQFALAGMNAHINRDLPVALVQTCEARGVAPRRPSPQQRDFQRIDGLLARVEERVKGELLTEALRDFDVALGQVDDVIAMWKVERAREAAWVNAETLWALRPLPRLSAEYLRTLDRIVGLAGRGLLRPLALSAARPSRRLDTGSDPAG